MHTVEDGERVWMFGQAGSGGSLGDFLESMVSSLGVGLGFLLAMVLFAGVRSKIDNSAPPKCLQGLPVTLIAASIVSLSFYGFASVVENLLK